MTTPSIDALETAAHSARKDLLKAIEASLLARFAFNSAADKVTKSLPEYAIWQQTRADVAKLHKEYDEAVAKFRTEQRIAN